MDARVAVHEEAEQDSAWARALRAATATSVAGTAVVAALHQFAGIGLGTLALAAAGAAITMGVTLPAARPSWLRAHDR